MESKEMLDLRYKRLNYYNRLISKENTPTPTDNRQEDYFQAIDHISPQKNVTSMQFIQNFFEGSSNQPSSATNAADLISAPHYLKSSFESDLSTQRMKTNNHYNKKLEEFKKVVENSYNMHVVKKNEISNSSQANSRTDFKNIFTNSQLSINESQMTESARPENENSYRSSETNSALTTTCKIPYMSAYNIYTEREPIIYSTDRRLSLSSTMEAHDIMGKYLDNIQGIVHDQANSLSIRKMSISSNEEKQTSSKAAITNTNKLSSNGSSLNSSPTSQSSSSSSFFVHQPQQSQSQPFHQQQQNQIIQVKPPETPRTKQAGSSYRKNLLKLSIDSAKNDSTIKSLSLNYNSDQEKAYSVKLSDSLELSPDLKHTIQSKNSNENLNKKLENFFKEDPKASHPAKLTVADTKKQKIKKSKNVFNFVNDRSGSYDGQEETKAEYNSDDENQDTFDIFSSQESLEKTIQENVKQLDLNIDLGCLSDQDNEEDTNGSDNSAQKKLVEKFDFDEDCSIIANENLTSNVLNSARQQQLQKKPDNIPNLMLDLMDDDKSQSVAASLAKSMCKEIDYHKEMETLYTLDSKEQVLEPIVSKSELTVTKKLNKLNFKPSSHYNSPIHLNKMIAAQHQKSQVSESVQKTTLASSRLKPPQSARLQSKLVASSNLDLARPESAAAGSSAHNHERNKDRIKLNKIDLTNQNNEQPKVKNELRKSKNFLSFSRESLVKKKTVSLKKNSVFLNNRPSSAMSNLTNLEKNNELIYLKDDSIEVNDKMRSKSSLFFDYSKLVSIESNLDQRQESVETNSEYLIESVRKSEFLSTDLVGDQEAYKKIFSNQNPTEIEKSNNEVNWLELPDEIWLRIIKLLDHKYLVEFGSVCKRFNSLYLDNSLWRKITMKYKYDVQNEWLEWIGKRRPNELNIIQCNGNLSLSSIVDMFRNIGDELQSLNLSRCSNVSLSGDNFALQASIRCRNITNLDLSWTLISNQTLKLITDSFRKIESINLSGCSMVGEDGFNFLITKHGETLKNLEISGCIHFSSSCVYNIGVYCRSLEKLNISNCHRMTNESIMEACPQWIKLKFLDLRGIKSIKNNCVSTIVRRCNRLEGLALGECIHLSDASILEIATYKPNIKYLDINGCKKITDNSIRSIANFCAKLDYLNLRATNISDIGLITLANGKCMKTLEELNLSYLPISELVLIKTLKNQTKLKRLHLYGCYNIKKLEEIKKSFTSENEQLHITINI